MIIDAHTHMLHSACFPGLIQAGGKWAQKAVDGVREQAKETPQLTDVKLRVEQLDRNGIDMQVVTPRRTFDSNLVPGDVSSQRAYARALNGGMARLAEESRG